MVRQWQELLHGGRYAESYTHSLPDFVKLAEAYHAVGIRCEKPGDLDGAIKEMIAVNKPVLFDCVVDQNENCYPMIPSGRAHNEMLLGDSGESVDEAVTEEGKSREFNLQLPERAGCGKNRDPHLVGDCR
jgi:acetolactate synthase-1/2/3 large subunit